MKNFQGKSQQQGLALLAALLIIVIFAIMGMTAVRKARESEQFAGADVRYGAVFEAAEQTLRRAAIYINKIDDIPKASGIGATMHPEVARNFDASTMPKKTELDFRGKETFVWSRERIKDTLTKLCKEKKYEPCSFTQLIDEQALWDSAVPSTFTTYKDGNVDKNISGNNYLNHIETYTFVEQLRSIACDEKKGFHSNKRLDACSNSNSEIKKKAYYLITIKASGYPPAMARTAENARENVIIQAVFLKR